ncbi:MAG: MoaD/ThiS family protein [Proteobacteria bacterium]|nr:MoaD/ThiS family protein [Pseudomonadota bacterium]
MRFFGQKRRISVTVKLLAGLDQADGYDPDRGIVLQIPEGTRLKKAVKTLNLPRQQPISYIINGEKVNPGAKLSDGDEIFCFLPFAGG